MKEFLSPPKKKIPFSQKFLGKTKFHIRKPLECSVGGVWTRWGIYGLIVFFCGVVVFHFHPASNQKFQSQFEKKETGVSQLAYLFYDAEGNVYDVFGTQGEHGVPQSWEYLFEGVEVMTGNDESAPEIQVPVQEETQFSTGSQSSSVSATGTVSTLPKPSDSLPADGEPENVDLPVAKVFPYAEKGVVWGAFFSGEKSALSGVLEDVDGLGVHIIEDYKTCATPWGYQLAHWESVLAYQQDMPTPDTCKIERRICFDGKLSGSFGQQSCATNTKYSYFQEQFVSYNTPQKSAPVVHPWNTAANVSDGSVKSWIEEILEVPNPSETSWKGSQYPLATPAKEVEQTTRPSLDCKAPWGEIVKQGQFVKAYKHKNGFNDAPCEVQLRTCAVGKLEGNYEQLYCRSRDISYIDWLNGIPNWDLGFSAEKLKWIQKIRESELKYQKEYGNALHSEVLEQILAILDT